MWSKPIDQFPISQDVGAIAVLCLRSTHFLVQFSWRIRYHNAVPNPGFASDDDAVGSSALSSRTITGTGVLIIGALNEDVRRIWFISIASGFLGSCSV
jgi:hypothetical protein